VSEVISYEGYSAFIDYNDEDKIFMGRIAGITDTVGFHADTIEELHTAFKEAVEDYLETCSRLGKEPLKRAAG